MPGPAKQPCYCVTCNGALMSNRTFRRHLTRPQVSRYDNSLVEESGESDSDNSDLDVRFSSFIIFVKVEFIYIFYNSGNPRT